MNGLHELGIISWTFLLVLLLVVPVVALFSIFKSDFKSNSAKGIWFFVVILIPIIGPVMYFAFGRKQRVKRI